MESGMPTAYDRAPDDFGGRSSLVLSPTTERTRNPWVTDGSGG